MMQYETIILELLSRIKNLEGGVETLKQQIGNLLLPDEQEETEASAEASGTYRADVSASYKKMKDKMIEICYRCGKKVQKGENPQELASEIADETGMNRNSAIMYLYAVNGMLEGTIYKRAISAKAMQKYFDIIFDEYGSAGLKKAIAATKLHINYRRECGHTVDSIEEICNRYERKL